MPQPSVSSIPPASTSAPRRAIGSPHTPTICARSASTSPSFGPSAWLLRAVPSALGRIDAATYLREVVAEAQTPDFQRLAAADRLRWSLACRAAIKSGAPLAFDEMSALIRDLEACDLGLTCPHGRPTVILLSRQLLDREFGRT